MLRILSPALKLNPSQTKCQQVASNGCVACQRQLRERSQLTDAACGRVGQGGVRGADRQVGQRRRDKMPLHKMCVYPRDATNVGDSKSAEQFGGSPPSLSL